jgi:hypothetical protein
MTFLIPIVFAVLVTVVSIWFWSTTTERGISLILFIALIVLAAIFLGCWFWLTLLALILFAMIGWYKNVNRGKLIPVLLALIAVGVSTFVTPACIKFDITGIKISSHFVVTAGETPKAVPTTLIEATVTPAPTSAAYCDPSTIPFTDMGELDSTVYTKISGPAIYEWWTGGSNEGVQRVDAGETITIHGAKGHWWTLPDQAGLECVWSLHVSNYGAKPQHEGKTINQLVVPPPAELLQPKPTPTK